MSGTDLGTQKGLLISPDVYRRLYKPYIRRMNDWVHKNTEWKTFYHSCGSIAALLDDFIEDGVDIINPVQMTAAGMNLADLKTRYGEKIVFWGGGIDTQHVLPFGSCDEVRQAVTENVDTLRPGGGFVFCPVHNIQDNTPPENLLCVYEQLRKCREY